MNLSDVHSYTRSVPSKPSFSQLRRVVAAAAAAALVAALVAAAGPAGERGGGINFGLKGIIMTYLSSCFSTPTKSVCILSQSRILLQ